MGLSSVFSSAVSGIGVYSQVLAATGHNLANANTVRRTSEDAFRPQRVRSEEVVGSPGTPGLGARSVVEDAGSAEGVLAFEPGHVLADDQGLVRLPGTDFATELTTMLGAEKGVAMNAAVVRRANEAYQSIIDMVS